MFRFRLMPSVLLAASVMSLAAAQQPETLTFYRFSQTHVADKQAFYTKLLKERAHKRSVALAVGAVTVTGVAAALIYKAYQEPENEKPPQTPPAAGAAGGVPPENMYWSQWAEEQRYRRSMRGMFSFTLKESLAWGLTMALGGFLTARGSEAWAWASDHIKNIVPFDDAQLMRALCVTALREAALYQQAMVEHYALIMSMSSGSPFVLRPLMDEMQFSHQVLVTVVESMMALEQCAVPGVKLDSEQRHYVQQQLASLGSQLNQLAAKLEVLLAPGAAMDAGFAQYIRAVATQVAHVSTVVHDACG